MIVSKYPKSSNFLGLWIVLFLICPKSLFFIAFIHDSWALKIAFFVYAQSPLFSGLSMSK